MSVQFVDKTFQLLLKLLDARVFLLQMFDLLVGVSHRVADVYQLQKLLIVLANVHIVLLDDVLEFNIILVFPTALKHGNTLIIVSVSILIIQLFLCAFSVGY